jgi:hypothetical protein
MVVSATQFKLSGLWAACPDDAEAVRGEKNMFNNESEEESLGLKFETKE